MKKLILYKKRLKNNQILHYMSDRREKKSYLK